MTTTTVLADDWALLRSVTSLDDEALVAEVAKRGARHAGEGSHGSDAHDAFVHAAAAAAAYRLDIVGGRDRHREAVEYGRAANERVVSLDRDVVPPLKQEAKALRAEIRRLEAELRAIGVDPSGIEPAIEWPTTLMVDDYGGPRFETPADRKRTVVAFFARRDEDR
jgi:hypothetical protein